LWDGATPNPKLETRNGESPSDVINQKRLERNEVMERLERFERLERLELTASGERSEAVERLEHLETGFGLCKSGFFTPKKHAVSL
jgi:hypothetical protein